MVTTPEDKATALYPDLALRVMAPRVPRDLLARPRLASNGALLGDAPVVLLLTPAGFGKTSLLAQWRLEYLSRGAAVGWLTASASDTPLRFLRALAMAVRSATGRPLFADHLFSDEHEASLSELALLLAELSHLAAAVTLVVDGAERLPPSSRDYLTYLVHNAPANLNVAVGATGSAAGLEQEVRDLIDYGQCRFLDRTQLAFTLPETMALARQRFGESVAADAAAHVHALTEGWPLGLQLVFSAAAREPDPAHSLALLTTADGGVTRAAEVMLDALDADDLEFLTQVAVVRDLHPSLCQAVSGDESAVARLTRLQREAPVFVSSENSDWCRIHTLVHDALLARFARIPLAGQRRLHARAAQWLASVDLLEEAARHAFLAGDAPTAFDYAERALYGAMTHRGQQNTVLEWLDRLPPEELYRRPPLALAGAWALALSERHNEAERLVERVLLGASGDDALRCECALILSGAATFGDDIDRAAGLHDRWAKNPPLADPLLQRIHANRCAFRAIFNGELSVARAALNHTAVQRAESASGTIRGTDAPAHDYIDSWRSCALAFAAWWEGQPLAVERIAGNALSAVERDGNRRHPLPATLAALLAAALLAQNRVDEAALCLANRFDVIERRGLPDSIIIGARTLSRIAAANEEDARALEMLDAMYAAGATRQLPRVCLTSIAEQVRLHAWRFHAATCATLCERLDALLVQGRMARRPQWARLIELPATLAHGYAAIAARDWGRALPLLQRAELLAGSLLRQRERLEAMALHAYALHQCGGDGRMMLSEALSLAASAGDARLLQDTHPALVDWANRVGSVVTPRALASNATGERVPVIYPRAVPSMTLTPKEREVLELVARNLSNKEIARAMQVGDETVKWHVKNLFLKLAADSRKHAVQRARLLGLFVTTS